MYYEKKSMYASDNAAYAQLRHTYCAWVARATAAEKMLALPSRSSTTYFLYHGVVGSGVGTGVGRLVGRLVGSRVGSAIGWLVSWLVGTGVGWLVGRLVGSGDGIGVSCRLGTGVGCEVQTDVLSTEHSPI